jgi:hypothetical protein
MSSIAAIFKKINKGRLPLANSKKSVFKGKIDRE